MPNIKISGFGIKFDIQEIETIFTKTNKASNEKDTETLNSIITQLIQDREQLLQHVRLYEAKFIEQQLDEGEINTIVNTIVPTIKKLAPNDVESIEMIENILSIETIKMLQVLGFDYKEAIGKPLTELSASYIRKNILNGKLNDELSLEQIKNNSLYNEILLDKEAFERMEKMLEKTNNSLL